MKLSKTIRGNLKLSNIVRKDFTQLVFVLFSFTLMVVVSYLFVSGIVEKQIASNAEATLNTAEAVIRSDLMEAEVALLNAEILLKIGMEWGDHPGDRGAASR